MKLPLR